MGFDHASFDVCWEGDLTGGARVGGIDDPPARGKWPVCVRERVCVCERESVCERVCVRESVCESVCVCERESEAEGAKAAATGWAILVMGECKP